MHAEYADALVCGTYKWLMSPRGTALLATTPELAERMVPLLAGLVRRRGPERLLLRAAAAAGQGRAAVRPLPRLVRWVGTAASLDVVESIGLAAMHAHDVALANRFRAGLGLRPGHSAIV